MGNNMLEEGIVYFKGSSKAKKIIKSFEKEFKEEELDSIQRKMYNANVKLFKAIYKDLKSLENDYDYVPFKEKKRYKEGYKTKAKESLKDMKKVLDDVKYNKFLRDYPHTRQLIIAFQEYCEDVAQAKVEAFVNDAMKYKESKEAEEAKNKEIVKESVEFILYHSKLVE